VAAETSGTGAAVYSIAYVSSATKPLTHAELTAMLKKGRANNARSGVTGMLLYKDGNFMQVLEGDEVAVRATFERISRDPRHHNLIVLLQGEKPKREFPEFLMGFYDLSSSEVHRIPGFSEFLNTPLTSEEFANNPTRSRRLLLAFKKGVSPRAQ
jgi:hypothetical protein